MRIRKGQWVTGQTIISDNTVTGRFIRSAAPVNGREVVVVSDEKNPEWRAPFHVFADTITMHGKKPEGV